MTELFPRNLSVTLSRHDEVKLIRFVLNYTNIYSRCNQIVSTVLTLKDGKGIRYTRDMAG